MLCNSTLRFETKEFFNYLNPELNSPEMNNPYIFEGLPTLAELVSVGTINKKKKRLRNNVIDNDLEKMKSFVKFDLLFKFPKSSIIPPPPNISYKTSQIHHESVRTGSVHIRKGNRRGRHAIIAIAFFYPAKS